MLFLNHFILLGCINATYLMNDAIGRKERMEKELPAFINPDLLDRHMKLSFNILTKLRHKESNF